jgi:hypothetical protein
MNHEDIHLHTQSTASNIFLPNRHNREERRTTAQNKCETGVIYAVRLYDYHYDCKYYHNHDHTSTTADKLAHAGGIQFESRQGHRLYCFSSFSSVPSGGQIPEISPWALPFKVNSDLLFTILPFYLTHPQIPTASLNKHYQHTLSPSRSSIRHCNPERVQPPGKSCIAPTHGWVKSYPSSLYVPLPMLLTSRETVPSDRTILSLAIVISGSCTWEALSRWTCFPSWHFKSQWLKTSRQ